MITNTGGALHDSGGFGAALVGMSDDGRRVYVIESSGHLTLWDDGVTTIVDPSVPREGAAPKQQITLSATQPGNGRVSPDGNRLAYIKGGVMYLYDHANESLTCASCSAYGGSAQASVEPQMTSGNGYDYIASRPRFLTDDGQVFFSTKTALVPEDTNGIFDVYEFDGQSGELHLLSSGTGSEPAMFADASRSGDDVFFATRQPLTGSDPDGVLDLYDARVGGGLPEPPPVPSPCSGESCQAPPPLPRVRPAPPPPWSAVPATPSRFGAAGRTGARSPATASPSA